MDSAYIQEIDPLFKNLYARLEDLCGVGISPLFEKGGKQYQYTTGCLMVYDPEAAAVKRYSLYPLGRRWGVEEPPEPQPDLENLDEKVYVNGHYVWDEIIELYIRVGSPLIGRPLTSVRYNAEKSRYEQFFENIGFYRDKDDLLGDVNALQYGIWMCGQACLGDQSNGEVNAPPATPPFTPVPADWQSAENTMMVFMDRLGRDFTGPPISETYVAPDGMFEKVFQNCMMFVDPRDLSRAQFRPLPLMVNIERQPPVPPQEVDGMYFYPVLGQDLGYNIYILFLDYITLHGTMEVFGPPIGELHSTADGISRQCYTNLCLEYHPKAPKSLRIRPAALGVQYLFNPVPTPTPVVDPYAVEVQATESPVIETAVEISVVESYTPEPTILGIQTELPQESTPEPTIEIQIQPSETPSPRQFSEPLNLQVWERYAMISPVEHQEIGVALLEGNQPISDVGFSLTVDILEGQQKVYVMPLTGPSGISMVTLEPINAPLGTVITYQVCITNLLDFPVCVKESFIIWGGG